MEWIDIFTNVGFPIAMVIYFVTDSKERAKEFVKAREMHLQAEKEAIDKYSVLTRETVKVMTETQEKIAQLVNQVEELAKTVSRISGSETR